MKQKFGGIRKKRNSLKIQRETTSCEATVFENQSLCLLLCSFNFHHPLISKNYEDDCTACT